MVLKFQMIGVNQGVISEANHLYNEEQERKISITIDAAAVPDAERNENQNAPGVTMGDYIIDPVEV